MACIEPPFHQEALHVPRQADNYYFYIYNYYYYYYYYYYKWLKGYAVLALMRRQ